MIRLEMKIKNCTIKRLEGVPYQIAADWELVAPVEVGPDCPIDSTWVNIDALALYTLENLYEAEGYSFSNIDYAVFNPDNADEGWIVAGIYPPVERQKNV